MPVLFWAIAITMSIVAIAFAAGLPSKLDLRSRKPLVATMILVPVFAIALYLDIGSPNAIDDAGVHQSNRIRPMTDRSAAEGKPIGSVDSMLDGLKQRLDDNPDDAGSWLLLAKSYDHLDRREEAIAAYKQAKLLGRSDADLAHALGDLTDLPAESQDALTPGLRGQVVLSESAREFVRPDDTVFIFAKESANQRMPLVALRKSVRDLPLQFSLTDADAMIAGTHLADYDQLVVSAKISRSGMATDVLEGLEALSEEVSPLTDQHISLTIASNLNLSPDMSRAND